MDERIKYVVVLMFENRSFDHMLGHLNQGHLPPLSTNDKVPRDPSNPAQGDVPVHWLKSYTDVSVDPGHGYDDVMKQLTGRKEEWKSPYQLTNEGFAWNYGERSGSPAVSEIMGCYPASCVPVLSTLAKEFGVCTRWHCSLPSETWPNRLFAHAGSSFGQIEFKWFKAISLRTTIFDLVERAGGSARIYEGDFAQARAFPRVWGRIRLMSSFDDDVRAGDLPHYTFIEPRHFDSPLGKCDSQHPTSEYLGIPATGDVGRGEVLLARVYTALRANPEVWERTLLIVTYDEHGGFYDRATPPEVPPTGDRAPNDFPFDLLGPRVPALVISPYVSAGTSENDATFEHTSITRTVRAVFGIDPFLSDRERTANTLLPLLSLDTPRTDDTPDLTDYTSESWFESGEDAGDKGLNDFQRQLLALMNEIDVEQGLEPVPEPETAAAAGERVEEFVRRQYGGEAASV